MAVLKEKRPKRGFIPHPNSIAHGFKKGHATSAETRAKISATKRANPTPASNPFPKGGTPWNATHGAFIDCAVCGEPKWFQNWQIAAPNKGKFCSRACSYKGRALKGVFQGGDKHPAYVDGRAGSAYPKEFSPRLKRKIRDRDNFTCQKCGKTEAEEIATGGRVLCVNHIDFNKQNCVEGNLNTLCLACNFAVNWDRPYWTEHFQKAVKG